MMNDYNVSDYGIFSDAISTTNILNNSVSNCQTAAKNCASIIGNQGVFMGPIAEKCTQFLNTLNTDLDMVQSNMNQISSYLMQTSSTYQSADANASSTVQLRLDQPVTTYSNNSNNPTLTGANNAEQIWNYLKSQGFSDAGIAGIMGNLAQESGLRADNVQNHMGYEDAEYVAGIKNGTITREDFINDSRGFGIAQWTYHTRKAKLYDTLGPQNIDSLAGQLSFMVNEMGDDLTNKLKNASSVNEATDVFQYSYERAGKPNMENRRNQANGFYSTYSG